MKFKNPQNGYIEEVSDLTWLWCLIFGAFYFAFKGIWIHFFFAAFVALVTLGFSWLIYPFFARSIIIKQYQRKGWQSISEDSVAQTHWSKGNSIDVLEPWRTSQESTTFKKDNIQTSYNKESTQMVVEVYRGFEIASAPDGFRVLGKTHSKISEARAEVDSAYEKTLNRSPSRRGTPVSAHVFL